MMMYTQDYDEKYSLAVSRVPDNGQTPPGGVWGSWSGVDIAIMWQQLMYPYTKSIEIYRCPSSSYTGYAGYGNYGANNNVLGYYNVEPKSIASIVAPASTYMMMDAGAYMMSTGNVPNPSKGWYIPGTAAFAQSGYAASTSYTSDWKNGRHFDGINMAFADGHAKWLKSTIVGQQAIDMRAGKPSAWDPANPN
jgi:prepilin-type processing-associated H-X9-DG protein